jgi:outer membrane immunogenic protein
MRKAAFGFVAVAAMIGTPALAADMPVKASPAPAPVYSWTGWYVGLNAGGGWQNTTIDNGVTSNSGIAFILFPALNGAIPQQFNTHPSGFIGGGQIGYNYQFAPNWVAGLEADFQGANIKGTANAANTVVDAGTGVITVAGSGSRKIDGLGTQRVRLGCFRSTRCSFMRLVVWPMAVSKPTCRF